MTARDAAETASAPIDTGRIADPTWRGAAIGLLVVRITQGFIYWGGGSRRFIYDPEKLDPGAHVWMANKLQDSMPGALFGTGHIVSFMLKHYEILYPALILFTAGEAIAGLMLIAGFLTRAAAAGSLVFSVILMILFGWQGAVCIEGWTMAACTIAMACALMLNGSGAWSLDNLLLKHAPGLQNRGWFRWLGGSLPLPLSERVSSRLGISLVLIASVFIVGSYSYYRGSVVTPFHEGPVSASVTHYTLSNARIANSAVHVHLYLDGGTPEAPSFIVEAALLDRAGNILADWNIQALSRLRPENIRNEYDYNRLGTGPYGLMAAMGAKAELDLPLPSNFVKPSPGTKLQFTTVDGRRFSVPVPVAVDPLPVASRQHFNQP